MRVTGRQATREGGKGPAVADAAGMAATPERQTANERNEVMTQNERMMKMLTANAATLAKVDAVLNGMDVKGAARAEADCRLVTFTEAAARLNLSRPTIYNLVKAGRLESVPIHAEPGSGKGSRIPLSSVVAFAEGRAN